MPSCVAFGCTNSTIKCKKKDGITFHRFPANEIKRALWTDILQEQRHDQFWKPTKATVICSLHFSEEDILLKNSGLRYLTKNAFPKFTKTTEERSQAPESDRCQKKRPGTPLEKSENLTTRTKRQRNSGMLERASISFYTRKEITPEKRPETPLNQIDFPELHQILATPRTSHYTKIIRQKNLMIQKLRNENRSLKRSKDNLKKKNISLKHSLKILTKKRLLTPDISKDLSENAAVVQIFHSLYLKNLKRRKKPTKTYPPAIRKFCLTLNFHSPRGYRYVRKTLNNCLPHPRTLYQWYQSINGEPGFTAEAFNALKLKSQISNGEKLNCCLMLDEMAIRQQKLWNGKKFEGIVNDGSKTESEIASQALVLMVVSLKENWKVPVGYFLIKGMNAEEKANIIKICLQKCDAAGVDILSLTFDGCKSNIGAARYLGCELENLQKMKTSFSHPSTGNRVVVFLDACHMLKLVRNTLESKRTFFVTEQESVNWRYLVNLLNVQEQENLHLANKLTSRHIYFRNQIMKVRLASQLLSKSVANAIRFCDETLKLPQFQIAAPTVEFISILNDLFDILNSRSLRTFGFKHPLNAVNKEEIFKFLDSAKSYLSKLKVTRITKRTIKRPRRLPIIKIKREKKLLVESKCKTGFIGLIVCIESLKQLYSELVENREALKFICTYKTSQDHLELFFSNMRSHGGSNNNPNARQFKEIYKKILNHLELSSVFTGNCIPIENFPILNCSSATNIINGTSNGYRHKDDQDENQVDSISNDDRYYQDLCVHYAEILDGSNNLSEFTKYIVGYIAGWVVRATIKKIKCDECISSLMSAEKMWYHKLISLKDLGGLCYPTNDVYTVCLKTENIIRELIKKSSGKSFSQDYAINSRLSILVLKSFVHTNTFNCLHEHSLEQPATFNHRIQIMRVIIDKYVNVRLHYIAKTDPSNTTETLRQKLNKYNLFRGN